MNCLDYRRALLTGEGETEAMHAHRLQCAVCGALLGEHSAFEDELRRALEVPVPGGLEDRLLDAILARHRAEPARRPGRRRFVAAAAAAAAAVVAAGAGLYAWIGRNDPVAMASIEFVMKEEAKSIMMGAISRAEAARALADSLPIERMELIGEIRHVRPCPFNGGTAYHIVLTAPQDKITLLVMPDAQLSARGRAVHEGLYADVIPLRKGSVGIVGTSPAVVESVAGALRS